MFLIKNFIYLLRIGVIKGAYRKFNFISEYLKVSKSFKRYPDSDGTFFRKVLAKKFNLKRDRIILGSGSDQIFELVCKLFLSKGDEVIVPEFTMIATGWSVHYAGLNPVFVDCDDALSTYV